MNASLIYKLIFAGLGIFGTFLGASRLLNGEWLSALWPLLIAGYCGYRLYTMQEEADAA
ncbi:MAG: hypothetical protein ACLFTE_05645 [Salinivenus sp.]